MHPIDLDKIDLDPVDLDPREDATAYKLWSKKRKAQESLIDEAHSVKAPANGQQMPHLKNTIANRYAAAQKERLSTSAAQCSVEGSQSFMVEQSLSSLLEILFSSSVGMGALTSRVAIFGVLQNAHACATTGDELGFEYVRIFIARLAKQTSDHEKVAKVTEVLHKKLQDQVLRAFAHAQSLSKLVPLIAGQSNDKIPSEKQSTAPAQQLVGEESMHTPKAAFKPPSNLRAIQSAPYKSVQMSSTGRQSDAKVAGNAQSKSLAPQPAVEKSVNTPNVLVKPPNVLKAVQPAPHKNVQMPVTSILKVEAKDLGIGSSKSRHIQAIKTEENVRDKSVVQNDRVLGPPVSHSNTVVESHVSHERPRNHVYTHTSSDGKDATNAAIIADIRNYTEPGEDLDWTKVSDPTERKRLQGIIGGRKYRERRLASQGQFGSGGNYPGAVGEASYLSTGYGSQRPYGYSKSKPPQPFTTSATPAYHPDRLYLSLTGSKVSRHSLSATNGSREPVVYHGLDEQSGNYWNHGHSAKTIERGEDASAGQASESSAMTSDVKQEAHAKSGEQGGYEDFFQSLMDSATPHEPQSRHGVNFTGFTNDGHQPSLTPRSPASMLIYDLDDGYQEPPEDERPTSQPNAGDVACFQSDKEMKTAFNMFARSAHDAHRFPVKTQKNAVETYHLFIHQVWNLLLEQDKIAWRSLAAARGCFSPKELSVKGQHILESQGFLSKFLPHVEPAFEEARDFPAAGA